jgi:glycosyltransferase involved in cell wall biosynthesis
VSSRRPATVTAAIHVTGDVARWIPTVRSLRHAHPEMPIVMSVAERQDTGPLARLGVELLSAPTLSTLLAALGRRSGGHVLAVSDPIVAPPGLLDGALEIVEADARVSTVSFLSNDAGFLSFPLRNGPSLRCPDGMDEASITRRLRVSAPVPQATPIPFAAGAAVLVSASALAMATPPGNTQPWAFEAALAEFCIQARARGFVDVLDPGTYCFRPADLARPPGEASLALVERGHVLDRHPRIARHLEEESTASGSPLGLALAGARSKVAGIRVLIDGGCLGPLETGTQVQVLSLVEALAARDDVARVCVALATAIPRYGQRVLSHPKVDARPVAGDDLSVFGEVDVAHRPYQPDRLIDFARWRQVASRIVVTVQDVIAYHIAQYHQTEASWLDYRVAMQRALRCADGVVVVSDDTGHQVARHRLPVDPTRLFTVPNGIDHLAGDEAASIPIELLSRGYVAGDFVLVLGTDYSHKNRDLGLRAWRELRRRGHTLGLVMAGAAVPYGSSRVLEALCEGDGTDVYTLPDVTHEERNWLLRHARLLLYPSSAEGFGLPPYEAARFGTPTVMVPFGPLAEVAGALPVWSEGWQPEALADASQRLLDDPALSRAQVESLQALEPALRWDATASRLAGIYRSLLERPPMSVTGAREPLTPTAAGR